MQSILLHGCFSCAALSLYSVLASVWSSSNLQCTHVLSKISTLRMTHGQPGLYENIYLSLTFLVFVRPAFCTMEWVYGICNRTEASVFNMQLTPVRLVISVNSMIFINL